MAKAKKSIVKDLKNDLGALMDFFISFKKAQGTATRTIKDYEVTFNEFKNTYGSSKIEKQQLSFAVLEYFKGKSNKAPATFNRPYANLHCFFEWCVNGDYLDKNPLKELGLKKKKDVGKVRHVEEDIIKKLIDLPTLNTYAGLRDYAIIVLTLDTGIRPSEAFELVTDDIDLIHFTVKIRRETAKTRVERILPISHQTAQILRRLISVKPDDWDDYLFFTVEGNKMNLNRWQKRLEVYSETIGYKVTPYMLRHTFSILFLRNGGNAFALQTVLGHTDLTMTKRYVKLMEGDVRQQHAMASPVNKFIKRTTRVQKLFKNK